MYLLPSLKKDCARKLKSLVDHKNVFKIYEISRLYELQHLESYCCEYMAADIEKVGIYYLHYYYCDSYINFTIF